MSGARPLLALALALGCTIHINGSTSETASSGGPMTTDASTTDGASSTSEGGSMSSTSGSASSSSSTDSSSTASTSTASTSTASTTADTTSAETTGSGACTCAAGEHCDWAVNSCGAIDSDPFVCEGKPDGCDDNYEPVCGCDGLVHSNECYAAADGVDISDNGGCTPPEGYFPCGHRFCDPLTSYCQISTSDVFPEPDFVACVPYPATCGDTPSCECLVDEPCADFGCADGPPGIVIICPGG